MEKMISFIKGHPVLTAVVAIGVLVIVFWPSSNSGGSGDGGASAAAAANAVAATQTASAQLQLSSDQVRAIGLQAATAQAINAQDNAAAVAVATLKNATDQKAIDAELSASQGATMAALSKAKIDQTTTLFGAIAAALPQTQANALASGVQTDAAGFGLLEMFKNILNVDKGLNTTTTLISTNVNSTTASVYKGDSATIGGSTYQIGWGSNYYLGDYDGETGQSKYIVNGKEDTSGKMR